MNPSDSHYQKIRRLTITALFADDVLYERIVLKGGNAISLVFGYGGRSSMDLDFSIEDDFVDFEGTRVRMFSALREHFDASGYVVFDERLVRKPRLDGPDERPWWGGYQLSFKVIEKQNMHGAASRRIDHLRKTSIPANPNQGRTFDVDLSKYEYTRGKVKRELDSFDIFVYSPEMIVIEKLRAICQQMEEYEFKGVRKARARDFFDIHLLVNKANVDLSTPENVELLKYIFGAKHVPLELLGRVGAQREFHRPDWPAVVASVDGQLEEFDWYFDFVLDQIQTLKSAGEKYFPL